MAAAATDGTASGVSVLTLVSYRLSADLEDQRLVMRGLWKIQL
jgi:hypothetical protein